MFDLSLSCLAAFAFGGMFLMDSVLADVIDYDQVPQPSMTFHALP